MKKIFTLFATAVIAMSAYAQEKEWNISDWDAATYTENKTIDGFTIYATSSGNVAVDGSNKTVDGVKYTKRLKTGGAGSYSDGVYSRVFSFDISGSGTVSFIATSSNSSDARVAGVAFGEFIAIPSSGENPEGLTTLDIATGDPQVKTVDYTGDATTVYIYSKSGGINFYDFKFTPAATEDPEPAEGAIAFNLVTQGADAKTLGSINSDVEIDGDEFTITNFLGGSDFIFKIESRDPGNEDVRMYNINPVSGSYELDASTGMSAYYYGIESLKDKYAVFMLDGNNAIRVKNPYIGKDLYSSVEKLYDDRGYAIDMLVFGTFETWDATAQDWVADKYPNAYNITATIPGEGQSGIENIVADEFDENAPVEYYNLQGIRLNEPAKGQVVICRQGSKVVKMVVR